MKFNRNVLTMASAVALAALSPAAFAVDAPPDFTTLSAGIAFGGLVVAIMAVALIKVGPLVAAWGAKKVLGMIGR